jgi:hypothetical protein
VNLRPNGIKEEVNVSKEVKEDGKDTYVKTSITLMRETAVRARKYVNDQQVAHAQGQRQNNYSFSQLFNDALNFYLEHLEKGELHEEST